MGWREYIESLRVLYRRRRDVMFEALEQHFGERASWTRPEGGLFIWATLDERIDTTDLLARARDTKGVAFVPGRAAFVDGLRGSSSMRLNFAGIPEPKIREGIRRIGAAISEQAALLGSLSGSPARGRASGPAPAETANAAPLADVVELPRRAGGAAERRRQDR
jgi:2-aminoadipate transaminase